MSVSNEKRREQRVSIELWIEAARGDEVYYQRASNLSVGGAYFTRTVPLPLGTRVSLKFSLPGEAQEITCAGEIVAAQDLGMGVHFLDLAPQDRDRLAQLVERLATSAAP
jgi:type IV pilus assembly protein PilZ